MKDRKNFGVVISKKRKSKTQKADNRDLINSFSKVPTLSEIYDKILSADSTLFTEPRPENLTYSWSDRIIGWPIGNQESTAMCVGFSVGLGLFSFFHSKGNLSLNLFSDRSFHCTEVVSARYTYMLSKLSHRTNDPDALALLLKDSTPTFVEKAIETLIHVGFVTEQNFPFVLNEGYIGMDINFNDDRLKFENSLSGYQKVQFFPEDSFTNEEPDFWNNTWTKAQNFLASTGPLVVTLSIDENWLAINEDNDLWQLENYDSSRQANHAVLLVGISFIGNNKYYILRNSMGEKWGKDGHVYVSEGYFRTALREIYGITKKTTLSNISVSYELHEKHIDGYFGLLFVLNKQGNYVWETCYSSTQRIQSINVTITEQPENVDQPQKHFHFERTPIKLSIPKRVIVKVTFISKNNYIKKYDKQIIKL